MWHPLKDYAGQWHYEDRRSEDWSPMRRLLAIAMQGSYASVIRAFNSLDTLVLTTADDYGVRAEHDFVSISYSPSRLLFSVGYGGIRSRQTASYCCHETQVSTLLESLVLRLLLSADVPPESDADVHEDQPAFALGDYVEVVLNDSNRTYRCGTIVQIVRHTKKRRYFYLLEVGGKTVSRRYYSDDLKRA